MQKIMVFGKPGGGKSIFSKKLSTATGIRSYSLDLVEYQRNGERVSKDQYTAEHNRLLKLESWIIEGFGTQSSFWSRIEAADTLIYIDLPYVIHYWWVLKRLIISPFKKAEGWPEGSSVLKGTIASLKHLKLSPKFWNPKLIDTIQSKSNGKKFHKISSTQQLKNFIKEIEEAQ